MPLPRYGDADYISNRLLHEEMSYNIEDFIFEFDILYTKLNQGQSKVFHNIITSCQEKKGEIFFVNASGGTGKTFLWKTIITKLRSDSKIVLAVASSGIASLLLPGGRTSHSRFKIPLQPHETSCCYITKQLNLADLI